MFPLNSEDAQTNKNKYGGFDVLQLCGTAGNPGNINDLIEMGYRFINIGADVVGLNQYCTSLVAELQKTVTRKQPEGGRNRISVIECSLV